MKKIITLFSALLLAVFLTACGQSDDNTNGATDNNETQGDSEQTEQGSNNDESNDSETDFPEKAEHQDDMKKMMEALDFEKIEVEISYGKDKEFELEIEHHSNGDIEAEVEDELNDIDIDDDLEAFNHIYPDVKKMNIDRGMEKEEVINQVLKAFDLADDYEEFEVEITFEDGTKISYED